MLKAWTLFALTVLTGLCVGYRPAVVAQGDTSDPQFGDDRFGITLTSDPQQLATLGARWYITYSLEPPSAPTPRGAVFVPALSLRLPPQATDLTRAVAAHPGSYWLMSNEPNVRGSGNEMTGEEYARALRDMVASIRAIDPAAKIVAPSIINFDFTCIACPGFKSGHAWMDEFLAAYQTDFGTLPPVDVWSIHTYPLDFEHFPQVNATSMEDQLTQFRKYLGAIPGLAGAPIWDTEVGTHWGYDGLLWKDDGNGGYKATPVGQYRTDLLLGYMQDLLAWLSQNGPALHIDRWFFFATYVDGAEPWETAYSGINLMDGRGASAAPTPFGSLYRRLSGLSP